MKQVNNSDKSQGERDILFSKVIKAGKRIYYIDVKRTVGGELFLTITESKKVIVERSEGEDSLVQFEKHKIFLYKEDFEKFNSAINEALVYIEDNKNESEAVCVPITTENEL